MNDLFTSFEDEPLGAASLAQVHKAVLKDGRTVAVKVQHRHVKTRAAVDIATMEVFEYFLQVFKLKFIVNIPTPLLQLLVKVVAKLFPSFQLLWLAEESKKNLPMELDFVNEGRNCERLSRMCSDVSYLKVGTCTCTRKPRSINAIIDTHGNVILVLIGRFQKSIGTTRQLAF